LIAVFLAGSKECLPAARLDLSTDGKVRFTSKGQSSSWHGKWDIGFDDTVIRLKFNWAGDESKVRDWSFYRKFEDSEVWKMLEGEVMLFPWVPWVVNPTDVGMD
jgi:hypothetical protein